MVSTHVLSRGPLGVRSPAELVWQSEQVVLGTCQQESSKDQMVIGVRPAEKLVFLTELATLAALYFVLDKSTIVR